MPRFCPLSVCDLPHFEASPMLQCGSILPLDGASCSFCPPSPPIQLPFRVLMLHHHHHYYHLPQALSNAKPHTHTIMTLKEEEQHLHHYYYYDYRKLQVQLQQRHRLTALELYYHNPGRNCAQSAAASAVEKGILKFIEFDAVAECQSPSKTSTHNYPIP